MRPEIKRLRPSSGPTTRGSCVIAPQTGINPRLTSGIPTLIGSSDASATRRRQASASSTPPPRHAPWITATVGIESTDKCSRHAQAMGCERLTLSRRTAGQDRLQVGPRAKAGRFGAPDHQPPCRWVSSRARRVGLRAHPAPSRRGNSGGSGLIEPEGPNAPGSLFPSPGCFSFVL